MRWLILLSILIGCTKHNPASCCTTEAQCSSLGLDQIYTCSGDAVCDPSGACVAAECATSADCASSDAPVCIGELCVAACGVDADCTGIVGKPYCNTDGACVACVADSQCAPSSPICDATVHTCRGCTHDAECAPGVCLEADGVCAPESRVVYVFQFGTDAGTCTKGSPCSTLSYALGQVTTSRDVLHLDAQSITLPSATLTIDRPVYIDGTATMLVGTVTTGATIALAQDITPVTLGELTIASQSDTAISVGTGNALRLHGTTIDAAVSVTNGTLTASNATFSNSLNVAGVNCTGATATFDESGFFGPYIDGSSCTLTVRRSKFQSSGSMMATSGGTVLVENSLFVETAAASDAASVQSVAPGSAVRFNTFVNTAAVSSDGTALACDSTLDVTSNIFAYGSAHPHGYSPACPTKYSLYDTVALPQYTMGTGDQVGDSATFFANEVGNDFHLSATSPARMAAEANLVVPDDYDGNPRPNPAGTNPDIGAFEAP